MNELASVSRIGFRSQLALFLLVPLAVGCGGEAPEDPTGASATDGTETVDVIALDVPAGTSPLAFQPIAPCLSESDYVRSGVVFVRGGSCSPRCVRLASGGTVAFVGAQPVEARNLGTESSPIQASRFGGMTEFEFSDYGFFPFRCGSSPEAIGVVWSTFW